MPPQWNPYEVPDPPEGLPPLVSPGSPLDDIFARETVPTPPVQPQSIPSDLLSLGNVPPPPEVPPTLTPMDAAGVPEPPAMLGQPEPMGDLYAVPEPPQQALEDLAPDFSATDYERSKDLLDEPLSVDVAGAARAAQMAERNYATLGTELATAQTNALGLAEEKRGIETQARGLDEIIVGLKATKKRSPEQEAELKAATEQRKALDGELVTTNQELTTAQEKQAIVEQQMARSEESYLTARAKADMDMAAGEREAALRGAQAQQAGTQYFIAESKKLDQEYRAKTDKIATESNAARARMDEDRKAYREALKAGPAKQSVVLTVAAVIGEALAARRTGREPDFGRVIGGLEAATKAQFDDRVQRQLALIGEGEDSLAKAAQERRIIEAEKAARKAEILSGIEIDIQSKMSAAQGTVQEAQLATVYSDVRRERERQDAIAMDARSKQAQADEKARLDRELQEAQIRKANAEASEKEGEAARKAGAGTGAAKEAAWSSRDPNKVYVPFTDSVLATFEGANADKRAEKAGGLVTDGFKYMKLLSEYEAMVEDYGTRKLMDRSTWTESTEYRQLATKHARLRTALAKVIAGQGFSTTESDNRSAEKMAPLPTSWNDTTLAALEQMKRDGEDDFRLTLNQAIDTKAQETLIREARRLGTSQTDVQRALVSRAPAVIADAAKPLATRLEAIAALSANVREDGAEGEQGDRDAIYAELQEIKNATTKITETEYDPEDPAVDEAGRLSSMTDDAYAVVQALRKREDELRALLRKVGTDNATKRTKERLEKPATPAALIESKGGIPSIR